MGIRHTDPETGELYTLDLTSELDADLRRHWAAECKHSDKAIRRAVVANGAIQYRFQCTSCGELVGSAIKKTAAPLDCPNVDANLADGHRKARQAALEQIYLTHLRKQKKTGTGYQDKYDAYLRSDAWAWRRSKVLKRANSICEGCLEAPATEVHHVSYAHVFNELLYELVALCDECHQKAHIFDVVTELEYRELACSSCRFGLWSETDGATCGKFNVSTGKALAKGGPCGPHAKEFEPLK